MSNPLKRSTASIKRENGDDGYSEDDEEIIEETKSLIVDAFLLEGSPVSESAKNKVEKIISSYGGEENIKNWIWGPNASNNQPFNPPTGFAMKVKKTSPVRTTVFHPTKMFYGTSVFCLDGVKFENGSEVTQERLLNQRSRLSQRIDKYIKQEGKDGGKLAKMDNFNENTCLEDTEWDEMLGGGGGAYAGIFSSSERGDYRYDNKFWLVVQSGYSSASEDLYRYMEEIGEKTTWENFFLKDEHTLYIYKLMRRNRNRLLFDLATALELKIPTDATDTDHTANKDKKVIKPTVETITNTVCKIDADHMVYYNNTINPDNVPTRGIIINESPLLGAVILKGPPSNGELFGLRWKSKQQNAIFPYCTGRQMELQSDSLEQPLADELSPFIPYSSASHFKQGINNNRLSLRVYRPRNVEFKQIETIMGYDHTWGEIQLKPIFVKISSSDI